MRSSVIFVALALVVAVAFGQTPAPTTITGGVATSYTSSQCADASGSMTPIGNQNVCVMPFETVCGTSICEDWNENCVTLPNNRGQACVSSGSYRAPDASTVIIAQIIIAGILFITGYVSLLFNVKIRENIMSTVVLTLVFLTTYTLIFSYFYLNGYVILAATSMAYVLYSTKSPSLTIAGMYVCLFALFWVCYSDGLGAIQHHSRFGAGNSISDTYETMCNQYYHGYFTAPVLTKEYNDNTQNQFWGFCNRFWLAALLMFMILDELYLVLMVAAGAFSLGQSWNCCDQKEESKTEPTAPAGDASAQEMTAAH